MKRSHSISLLALALCVLPATAGAGPRVSLSAMGGAAISGPGGPGGAVAIEVLAEPAPMLSIGLEVGSHYYKADPPQLMAFESGTAIDGVNRNAAFFIGPVMRANLVRSTGRLYVVSSIGYQSSTSRLDYGLDLRSRGTEESFGVGLEHGSRLAPAVELRWRNMQNYGRLYDNRAGSSVTVTGGLHFR